MKFPKSFLISLVVAVGLLCYGGFGSVPMAQAYMWQDVLDDTVLTSTSNNRTNPVLGVDSSGDIHIVWGGFDSGNEIYYSKLYSDGTTALVDTKLTSSSGNAFYADLVVDSADNIHVAWRDYRSGQDGIWYKKLDNNGNTVIDDTRVTSGSGSTNTPSLAVDSADNIHIAWSDMRDGSTWEVYYTKLYSDATTAVADTRVSSNDGLQSAKPSLGVDSAGNPHIAWYENLGSNFQIYYSKLNGSDGSTLVEDSKISSSGVYSSYDPDLTVDSADNIHIAWHDGNAGDAEIFYSKLNNDGTTAIEDTRVSSGAVSSGIILEPSLAVDSSGNIYIAWNDMRDGNPEIYFTQLYSDASTAVADTRLTNDSGNSRYPSLGLGSIHIAWMDDRDGDYEIYYTQGITGPSPTIVTPTPDNPIPLPGNTVCIQADIADVTDLYAVSFDMGYDGTVVTFNNASTSKGLFLDDGTPANAEMLAELLDGNEGQLVVGISRIGDIGGVSGSGDMADICFDVVGPACSSSDINFTNTTLEGPNQGDTIAASWGTTSINVALPDPTGLAAVDAGTHDQINLSWSAAAGATSYDIYRSDSSGSGFEFLINVLGTTHPDSDCIIPTLNYYYYVVAKVDSCASNPTAEASGSVAGLLGDINNDGRVDGRDLSRLARNFGTNDDCLADLDRTDLIDGDDLSILATNFGTTLP